MEKALAVLAGIVLSLSVPAYASPAVSGQTTQGGTLTGCDSNEVWLALTSLMNNTATFVLSIPCAATNYCYNVLMTTNLTPPCKWQWVARCDSGETNAVVPNPPSAQAFFVAENPIRPGFTQTNLAANDDGSTGQVPLPFNINFLSNSESALYINNNGNVTFNGSIYNYTPQPLSSEGAPIIAPFWADVDTRNPASELVTYGTNVVNCHSAFGVDWVNVGYYDENADKLLSCQLVLIERSDIAPGDFDMEFNYSKVQWEAGDASGGSDGIWMGTDGGPARAGFSDGLSNGTSYELQGSGLKGAFLDTNTVTGLIYNSLNSTVMGRYRFLFRNGQPFSN
jgi:hypothetical protein